MSPTAVHSSGSAPARIRTVIVDDEPAARRGLRLLLERDPQVEVVGEAADGAAAAQLIRRLQPDLLFLDVQMPGGDGFETLARVGVAAAPVVVFVTAHDEHAVRAFEVNAIDYLLKPFDDARFEAALQRAKTALRQRQPAGADARLEQLLRYWDERAHGAALQDRIVVKTSGEILFLRADEVDWIGADGDYVRFHAGERNYLMRETMAELEARLDPRRFVRIHRSTIVNLDRVHKLSPTFTGEYAVVLRDGTKLKLSRGYHDRLAPLLR